MNDDRVISEAMSLLASRKWAKATPEEKAEQARRMTAGRRRKLRKAKRWAKAKEAK
jgi:hypothetical protein